MAVPFLPFPGSLPIPELGPNSIFVGGILDFSSTCEPATKPDISICECGRPKTLWPSMTRVYRFSLVWVYATRAMAESIISEFETLGLNGFEYDYPGDEFVYTCYWVNSPEIHPVDYTDLWNVKAELIGVRL